MAAPAKAEPRWLRPVVLAAATLLLLTLFSAEIRDTDVWLNLKTGQHTLATRALTVPDPFSYTSQMAPSYPGEEVTRRFNLTHNWLAQIAMYLVYATSGFAGLVGVRALLLIVFCGITGFVAFRRTRDEYLGLAAVFASAGVAYHYGQSRPFLVTFVCLAITLLVLETRQRMRLLPPLFLIWANCHGGFFAGWLVLAAYCAEAVWLRLQGRPCKNDCQLWWVTAASVVLSGLNPNGFRIIETLLFYRSASVIQTENLEWQRPIFWQPGFYSFLLFGTLLALIYSGRRVRQADWLLFLGFAAMSLMAVRNVIFLALICPPLMAVYLPKRRWTGPLASILLAAVLIVSDVAPAFAAGNTLAFRAAEWQLPAGAAAFIESHQLKDRMFNGYENGGYLAWRLWPLQRVFIDPRGLSEKAYRDYRHILMNTGPRGEKGAGTLLAEYGIEMIVLDGFDYLSGQVYPLVMELPNSPGQEWKLVYTDQQSVILMRQPPAGTRALDPMRTLLPSLESQCELHLRHDPGRPHCARGLAELYSILGDTAASRRWIEFYLERRTGPDPEAERIKGSLEVTAWNDSGLAAQASGDLVGAEGAFRRALAIAEKSLGREHPDTAGTLNNLGALFQAKGDLEQSETLYRRALAICEKRLPPDDPRTARTLDNLAGILEAKGDLAAASSLYGRALAIAERSLGEDSEEAHALRESLRRIPKR